MSECWSESFIWRWTSSLINKYLILTVIIYIYISSTLANLSCTHENCMESRDMKLSNTFGITIICRSEFQRTCQTNYRVQKLSCSGEVLDSQVIILEWSNPSITINLLLTWRVFFPIMRIFCITTIYHDHILGCWSGLWFGWTMHSSPNPCIMGVMETQLRPKLKCVTVKIGHDRTTRRCRGPKYIPHAAGPKLLRLLKEVLLQTQQTQGNAFATAWTCSGSGGSWNCQSSAASSWRRSSPVRSGLRVCHRLRIQRSFFELDGWQILRGSLQKKTWPKKCREQESKNHPQQQKPRKTNLDAGCCR